MDHGIQYLVGHKVQAVVVPLKKEKKEYNWTLLLESGIKIHNLSDTKRPDNADVENMVIGAIGLGTDDSKVLLYAGSPAELKTELMFTKYEIEYPGGIEPNVPQPRNVDPEADRPPDPAKERIAKGPSESAED